MTTVADAPSSEPVSPKPVELPDTESLILTYQAISEWIRFADAKAAVTLTVNGALAGLFIPTLRPYLNAAGHPTAWWSLLVAILFGLWLWFLGCSSFWAFRCILPFTRRGRHPALAACTHFHPAAISQKYGIDDAVQFGEGYSRLGAEGFKVEITAAILIDSHISAAKYFRVTRAIRLLAVGAVCGLLYLLAIQL